VIQAGPRPIILLEPLYTVFSEHHLEVEGDAMRESRSSLEDAADAVPEKHERRFTKIANDMDNLLREIREYIPDANMYLEDSGNWNLMTGDGHDEEEGPRHDRVAVFVRVPHTGGGAW
jgi:hypothetical protein